MKINEEFYSYDKNNAQFEFIMDYDIPADKVIALFHFENTNRYYETLCQFKGNLITIEFDTSLIVEDELVTGYLYFDKLEKSTDVYRFTFGARLSEIDKTRELPVEEKVSRRIVPVADIVTKQELEELMDKIKKNGGTYDDAEIRNSISSISERVKTLENKPDDDSDVKSRLSTLESNSSRYLTEHQPLNSIEERIQQVEARFNNLSNIYLSIHQSLEHLATKDALGKIEQRVEQLEQNRSVDSSIENRLTALENKPTVDTGQFAKKSEIPQPYNDSELRNQITLLETNSVTKEKVESVENRVQVLENKSVVTHEELENAGYAKNTDLTNLANNSKVEAVESRVLALENKPTIIPPGYDDSALSGRVSALEAKPEVDVSVFAKKTEVPTIDSVNNLLRTQGEQATKITALEAKSAYEIHGTGMPNRQVSAPIGTTYVDMSVTNGALKWIKESGDGNTGWEILIGDTGWRTLNSVSKSGNSFVKVRRVNNQITYQFGGLEWGWFGIVRRGGNGYFGQATDYERNCFILRNNDIPAGFRTPNSLIGPIYNDRGTPYGTWYLGNPSDNNHLRFQFLNPVPTDQDIGDIRVSTISYYTDDEWPTTLP